MTLGDYLTIWAEWMRSDDGPDRHPAVANGFDDARTNYSVSIEDSAHLADMREASYGPIIDACIESLAPYERLAIHHVFGFSRGVRLQGWNAGIVMTAVLPRLAAIVRQRLPLDESRLLSHGCNVELDVSA